MTWYQEYLKSDHWQKIRDEALEYAGHRCQICNAEGPELNAHHRSYDRIGDEWPQDLTVLCRDCHALFHGKLPTAPPSVPRRPSPEASLHWVAMHCPEWRARIGPLPELSEGQITALRFEPAPSGDIAAVVKHALDRLRARALQAERRRLTEQLEAGTLPPTDLARLAELGKELANLNPGRWNTIR